MHRRLPVGPAVFVTCYYFLLGAVPDLHSFPTRRSSDLFGIRSGRGNHRSFYSQIQSGSSSSSRGYMPAQAPNVYILTTQMLATSACFELNVIKPSGINQLSAGNE